MAYEAAQAALDEMIDAHAQQIRKLIAGGLSADEALASAVGAFLAVAARQESATAGATHHALALHRLSQWRERITELEEQVAMRDAVIRTLSELEEL